MGLEGAGFPYVHPSRVSELRPTTAGWLSHEDGLGFLVGGPGHWPNNLSELPFVLESVDQVLSVLHSA